MLTKKIDIAKRILHFTDFTLILHSLQNIAQQFGPKNGDSSKNGDSGMHIFKVEVHEKNIFCSNNRKICEI